MWRFVETSSWNEKYLDYEIETAKISGWQTRERRAWNEKYLDYEIETGTRIRYAAGLAFLEMKSISITRLKRANTWLALRFQPLSWNEKYLDYEIETRLIPYSWWSLSGLKWKVSRLRDWNNI